MADWRVRLADWLTSQARPTRDTVAPVAMPRTRSLDGLVQQLRDAFALDDGQTASLSLIRRGAIYACVGLRADMLSGLPLCLYRVTPTGTGRIVPVSEPWQRFGMPSMARGRRLAERGEIEEVQGHPLLSALRRPNADWSGRGLLHMTETGLGLVGQAHWRLHRSGSGVPDAISWVRDGRLEVRKPRTDEERATYRTVAGWTLDGAIGGRGEQLPAEEVVWYRYPDPEDPDYGALAPGAIARLGADSYTSALRANRDIFRRGLRADAIVTPGEEFAGQWSSENVGELQMMIDRILSGEHSNHSVRALPYPMTFERLDVTAKDAEFVALMEICIEDAARAYRIPIEMVGGTRRTYQNNEASDRALWQRSLEPQTSWLAEEMTARLMPAWGLDPDEYFLGFDLSEVVALQDDESLRWAREKEQLELGVLQLNEWRAAQGMEPLESAVERMTAAHLSALLQGLSMVSAGSISSDTMQALMVEAMGFPAEAASSIAGGVQATVNVEPRSIVDMVNEVTYRIVPPRAEEDGPAFGSREHRAIMDKMEQALGPHERRMAREAAALFDAQLSSVLDKLSDLGRVHGEANKRIKIGDLPKLFSRQRWTRDSRQRFLPLMAAAGLDGAAAALSSLGMDAADDLHSAAANALRRRSQRFAVRVTDTTWEALREALAKSIENGDTLRKMRGIVRETFTDAKRWRVAAIARTESHGAYQIGGRETVRAMGGNIEKRWFANLDARVRDAHRNLHLTTIPLNEDFRSGAGGSGDGPGEMGKAADDINCRCTLTYRRIRRADDAADLGRDAHAIPETH